MSLRAGPLSSPQIIETLNTHFVNVWILAKSLEPMAREAASPAVRIWAAKLRDDYTYPVDSILYTHDGRKLAEVSTNSLIKGRKMHQGYLRFLRKGLPELPESH